MTQQEILALIVAERRRQDEKWGEQNHAPVKWLAILLEEAGEAAKAALENEYGLYVQELVQVAAVAVVAIESLCRQASWESEKEGDDEALNEGKAIPPKPKPPSIQIFKEHEKGPSPE